MAGILGIPPRFCHNCAKLPRKPTGPSSKDARSPKKPLPLYTNSLIDGKIAKHPQKLSSKKHLAGFPAIDGQRYPSREDANRANRALMERETTSRLERKEKAYLERFKHAAERGDIVFTKEGVYETKPCASCVVYHKVELPSLCSVNEPSQLVKLAPTFPVSVSEVSEPSYACVAYPRSRCGSACACARATIQYVDVRATLLLTSLLQLPVVYWLGSAFHCY